MALAGLDVGTSGCKLVVYDLDGQILSAAHRSYEVVQVGNYRILYPDVILENVKQVIREAVEKSPQKIEGFAITSLGESTVALDGNGSILYHSMAVGDCRGIEENQRLIEQVGKYEIMRITGLPASEMYSLPKWMWMNEHTDVFQRAEHLFLYEDFIGYYLTGKRKVSYSSASRTMTFDIEKKQWSQKLLSLAGLTVQMMSEPVASGTVIGTVLPGRAQELGLPQETVIVAGGHDQGCAALGAGVDCADVIANGHGSCEALVALMQNPVKTQYMIDNDLVCVPHVIPDAYLTYLIQPTCGVLMNWARDTLFAKEFMQANANGTDVFAQMDKMAGKHPSGLLALTQFGSSGMPHVDYNAKGVFWGLTTATTNAQMYRALKESMAFQMLYAFEFLKPLGIAQGKLRLTGGGASSKLTLQMRADIFGTEAACLESSESGTLGCMMLTGVALGAYSDIAQAVSRTVRVGKTYAPNAAMHTEYMQFYEKFKKLYQLMHNFK
ncbi:FGGY-family carbohydrate kinase [Oscillospiraceae bacterium PP1C4]